MRQLILRVTAKDCIKQTFRAGGKGGQNQNKRDTGVRFIHPPSGAVGEARDERSQGQNTKLAWRRMAESQAMQRWLTQMTSGDVNEIEAAVGSDIRIRTYNAIEGYAKDHRTGKRADLDSVLNGELDLLS